MQKDYSTPKGKQILQGARAAFLALGYEGASTDEIVRRARVSKGTLYSYFPDKAAIFAAFVKEECQRQAEHIFTIEPSRTDTEQTLKEVARSYLQFLTSDDAIRMFRLIVGEAERFPFLGQAFYDSGPRVGIERLARYLETQSAMGRLAVTDAEQAAHEFTELCRANLFYRRLLGIQQTVNAEEITRYADKAVSLFLRVYAPSR